MGTPVFAVRVLEALVDAGHEIAAVYTQPPAPRGRGQALKPSPVQAAAQARGLAVLTPPSMRDAGEIARFQALALDAAVVAAYGQILVREVLEAPRLGCFNLHASLLPRWRGAAPIQRAIMAGDAETGVQVMRMGEGLDEGPVLASHALAIGLDDTAGVLVARLADAAAALIPGALDAVARGEAVETPQAEVGVTYARKIRSTEARIDWRRPAIELDRHIRGLSPAPGAWFEAPAPRGPVRVKALMSREDFGVADAPVGAPGEVLDAAGGGAAALRVACGEGAVRLMILQREGRGAQDAEAFLRGMALAPGLRLG